MEFTSYRDKNTGLTHYESSSGALSEGYKFAFNFKEGIALVRKQDDLYYFIDEDFNTINEKGLPRSKVEYYLNLVVPPDMVSLDGISESLYFLPDCLFGGSYLNAIMEIEKRLYEYNIRMTNNDEEREIVYKYFEDRAEYIKGKALDLFNDQKQKEESSKENYIAKPLF